MEEENEQGQKDFGEVVEKEIESETEVELMEFSLDKNEINEFILRLELLKEEKGSVSFEIDEKNELLIHYEKEESEDEEEVKEPEE